MHQENKRIRYGAFFPDVQGTLDDKIRVPLHSSLEGEALHQMEHVPGWGHRPFCLAGVKTILFGWGLSFLAGPVCVVCRWSMSMDAAQAHPIPPCTTLQAVILL